jgi:hypothetical protein
MESPDQNTAPASFERELSPEEERNVLVNFMGNIYGQTKKIDSNVVGASTTLGNNKSNGIKQHIEKLVSQPLAGRSGTGTDLGGTPAVNTVNPPVTQPVQPVAQAATQRVFTPPVQLEPVTDPDQMMLNFDVNEKDELFDMITKLLTQVDKLHRKVDNMSTQLDGKQSVKKKSAV